MNKIIIVWLIIISALTPLMSYIAFAQVVEPTETRKEYVYCPIDINALDKSISYEINGCPTIRIYVEEYDRLTSLQKLDIDTQLKLDGFTAKEDFKINEFTGRIITDTEVTAK